MPPCLPFSAPHRYARSGISRALAVATFLALAAAGCSGDHRPQLVIAEFQDEVQPDGAAEQEETILLTFAEPLVADLDLAPLDVLLGPASDWQKSISRTDDPRVLRVEILAGTPRIRLGGVHGYDAEATGVGLDWGDGQLEWVDLQPRRSHPVLERVIWEDRPAPHGDLVVDEEDHLRLVFDRPVALAPAAVGEDIGNDVHVEGSDALGRGESPAVLEESAEEDEVRLVLGSDPLLAVDPSRPGGPSSLSLRGTPILPFSRVTDPNTGEGAISRRRVPVELPAGFRAPRLRADMGFPDRATRADHSVTPFLGWKAILAGGRRVPGYELLDEVLLFDPYHEQTGGEPFSAVTGRLPSPRIQHTATRLAGPDGARGTADDVVIIAGGYDGERVRGDLVAIVPDGGTGARVITLATTLELPRRLHAAAEGLPNQLVVDGGESQEGLIECAEALTFQFAGGDVAVAQHRTFVTLARTEHTLTRVVRPDGTPFLLAYGGYGRDRRQNRHPRPELGPIGSDGSALPVEARYFRGVALTVLVSPVLIAPGAPSESISFLDTAAGLGASFDFALPRRLHGAAAFAHEKGAGVVILGGTSRHPVENFAGIYTLWEMPLLPDRPDGDETSHAVVVRIDFTDLRASTFQVVRHPSQEPPERTHFAVVPVDGLGVFAVGGEPATLRIPFRFADAFLLPAGRLRPLAVPLTMARTRHGAYLAEVDGRRSIFVLGGEFEPGASAAAVEEIPLPPR